MVITQTVFFHLYHHVTVSSNLYHSQSLTKVVLCFRSMTEYIDKITSVGQLTVVISALISVCIVHALFPLFFVAQ